MHAGKGICLFTHYTCELSMDDYICEIKFMSTTETLALSLAKLKWKLISFHNVRVYTYIYN